MSATTESNRDPVTFKRVLGALAVLAARFVIVPVFSVVERLVCVRITPHYTMRIGALAASCHWHLARLKQGPIQPPERRVFFGAAPCNRQLFTMIKRVLPTVENRPLAAFYQYAADELHRSPVFRPLRTNIRFDRLETCNELVSGSGPVLSFTPDEEARGRALLASMGIGADDWFVCFQARESAYQHHNTGGADHYAHRNAPLESFLPAARQITARGGFAVRIGYMAETPLPETGDPRIVDYARHHRSDFGDIYLLAKCRFFLASSTGTQTVPPMFSVPVACAHSIEILPVETGRQSLFIPKFLREKATGRILGFSEWFQLTLEEQQKDIARHYPSYDRPLKLLDFGVEDTFHFYENDTYTVIDNSADDVADLCLDMLDRRDGVAPKPEWLHYQELYQENFLALSDHFTSAADYWRFGPRIGPRFAYKHRALIGEAAPLKFQTRPGPQARVDAQRAAIP
jgi:putative glycosyltransferase (TIGR04372 family)